MKAHPHLPSSQVPMAVLESLQRSQVTTVREAEDESQLPHFKSFSHRVDGPTNKAGTFTKFQARYIVVFMGFWCWFMFNCLRMTASLTIVAMVNWTEVSSGPNSSSLVSCDFNRTRDLLDGPFLWDTKVQGAIMSAYFYGMASSQLPGGALAERYSPKWVILLGTLLAAITCLLSPVGSYYSSSVMIALMALKGIGQGIMVPAFSVLAGKWFPVQERSRLMAICVSGMPFGGFFTLISSGFMSESSWSWPFVYYFWGVFGCAFVLAWYLLIYDSPMDHPHISHRELFRIMSLRTQEAARLAIKPPLPIKAICKSLPAWAYTLVGFASFWTISLYNIILPTFMGTILQFNLVTNGIMSSFPQLAQAIILLLANIICGYLQENNVATATTIRKTSMSLGLTCFVLCMCGITVVGCDTVLTVFLLTLAFGLTGINFAAVMVVPVDLSPRYAGTLSGFMSIFGSLSGVFIPTTVVLLAGSKVVDLQDWFFVFYLSAGLCFFAVVFFLIFGSSEVQPWNYPEFAQRSETRTRTSRKHLIPRRRKRPVQEPETAKPSEAQPEPIGGPSTS